MFYRIVFGTGPVIRTPMQSKGKSNADKAGCYRPKPYGGEYRTLSNFWIFDDKYISWVWRNTARALEFVNNKNTLKGFKTEIIRSINENDKALAQKLVDEFKLEVV